MGRGSKNCAGVTSVWARDYAVQLFVVNVLVSNDMYRVRMSCAFSSVKKHFHVQQ